MRLFLAAILSLCTVLPGQAATVTNSFSTPGPLGLMGYTPETFDFSVTYDPTTVVGAYTTNNATFQSNLYDVSGVLKVGGEQANVISTSIQLQRRSSGRDLLLIRYILQTANVAPFGSGNCFSDGQDDGFSVATASANPACGDLNAIYFTFIGGRDAFVPGGLVLGSSLAGVQTPGVTMEMQVEWFYSSRRNWNRAIHVFGGETFSFVGTSTAVPVPAAAPLLLSGLAGMGLVGMWRKRSAKRAKTA